MAANIAAAAAAGEVPVSPRREAVDARIMAGLAAPTRATGRARCAAAGVAATATACSITWDVRDRSCIRASVHPDTGVGVDPAIRCCRRRTLADGIR